MSSYLIVAVLWVIAIWRAPTAWQQPWKRAPWVCIFMLAVALTVDLPPVITAIDHSTGITDLATLVKLLAGVAAATAVADGVIATNMPGHAPRLTQRWCIPGGVAMAALVFVFILMPRRETQHFTESVAGGLPAVFLLIFYAYLGAAVAATAVLYLRAGRVRSAPSARAGMWLVTAACVFGLLFVARMIGYLAFRFAGAVPPGGVTQYLSRTDVIEAVSLLLLAAGMCLPALAVGAASGRDLLTLRSLHPLWHDVTSAVPEVKAGPWPGGIARIRDPHVRLIRRVTEIRDAAIHLRRYVPAEVITAARQRLSEHGLDGRSLDAAAEACWLTLAIQARAAGHPAAQAPHLLPGGTGLREEASWLNEVSAARDSPAVRSLIPDTMTSSNHGAAAVTTRAARFARLVTSISEPATWVIILAALIGWHTAGLTGLGWGLIGAGFAAVIPEVFITWGLRRGHWADRHVPVRHQRIIVLTFIIVSVGAGVSLLAGLGAPWPVTAAVLVMLIMVIALLSVTVVWKISVHSAAAAGAAFILVTVFGLVVLPVYALVGLTGWSRLTLRAHTLAQVRAGAALGTACSALYLLIR